MALETATYISDLVTTNPTSTDPKSQGDDHLRLIKTTLKNSFAGFPGMVIVTGSEAQGATVNDYTVTISPAPAAYTTPLLVVFKAAHANTGAATVQINALGTKSLLAVDGTALKTGDIESGGFIAAYYDGTSFYLVSGNDRANRNGETYSGTHNLTAATITVPTKTQGDNSTNAASTAYVDSSTAAEAVIRASNDATLQSNINAKADIASPVLTGIPTAPTATPGTNTTQIATTAFVVQQAFLAALPAQNGNNGKVLWTDGANAYWGEGLPAQNGNLGKVLKTNGSASYWEWETPLLPAIGGGPLAAKGGAYSIVDGGSYTLPDITGYPGFSIISAANAITLPTAVTTSDGWSVQTGFSAGTTKVITPLYAGVAHGLWGANVTVTPAQLRSLTPGMTLTNPVLRASVDLDATKTLLIVDPNSSTSSRQWFAVIYDSNTDVFGTPVLMTASSLNYGARVSVQIISSTSFILARNITTTSAEVVAASISGTTIILGTPYTHATKALCTGIRVDVPPLFVKLSNTLFLGLFFTSGTAAGAIAFSLSGTTITAGTEVAITACCGPRLIACSSTTALLVCQTNTINNPNSGKALIISVSGTTCTVNTSVTTDSNLSGDDEGFCLDEFAAGSTYLFAAKTYGGNSGNLKCITVSGTSVSMGSATASTGSPITGDRKSVWNLKGNSTNTVYVNAIKIDASTILVPLSNGIGLRPITLSGTTIGTGAAESGYGNFLYWDVDQNLYAYSSALSRLSVSGSGVTILESVTQANPSALMSATVTDKAVKYGSTWYAWAIANTPIGAVTNNKMLFVDSTDTSKLKVVGPMR